MKAIDIKGKTKEELMTILTDLNKQIQKTREDIMATKEKNVKKARFMRKDIARIHTALKGVQNA